MNLTSVSAKEIYSEVRESGKFKDYVKCDYCGGRGSLRDNITGKVILCRKCSGYGFYKM